MDLDFLKKTINNVKHVIPEQGPLDYFVHHNTLHHYENMNFFDAVKKGAHSYGSNAFMPLKYYIKQYRQRRIANADIAYVIEEFILQHNLNIPYHLIKQLLLNLNDKAKENNYQSEIEQAQVKYIDEKIYFYHKIIEEEYGIDSDFPVLTTLYKFLPNYFDFGSAYWKMQGREQGIWKCFCKLHNNASWLDNKFRKNLSQLVIKYQHMNAEDVLIDLLQDLDLEQSSINNYLFELCYKHKGWAGLIKSLEEHPEWNDVPEIQANFLEFVTVCLVCEYASIKPYLSQIRLQIPLTKKVPQHSTKLLQSFFKTLNQNKQLYTELIKVLPLLTELKCQELLHKAYEKSFYAQILSAYSQLKVNNNFRHKYAYQAIVCIDDRVESFRRYLEIDPECETFGFAGHFGLNIAYKSYFDKHYRALCPVNAKAEYKITEQADQARPFLLRLIHTYGELQWFANNGSKTFIRGYLLPFVSMIFNVVPFALDVINPSILSRIKRRITYYSQRSIETHLVYQAELSTSKDKIIGIPFQDRLMQATNLLTSIGLTQSFSKYVFIIGHGSSSLNNPHEAAHDCGACGGGRGHANARLMANILNENNIRAQLASEYNIQIPKSTIFIGAYHNTCNNDLSYFDLPKNYYAGLPDLFEKFKLALALDAKEKCRRYSSIYTHKPEQYYLKHIQARSQDYRQPRPEYGHSTNAMCIIGPRSKTRSLFLDRRAFLVSYDYLQDKNGDVLTKLVNAAIPVCAGINLEYYFSFVDNENYGCGTKLPHNVTSLLGVMNGHLSDLQLGLPWQMVEIHEPVRLFVMIVTPIRVVKSLLINNPDFAQLTKNEWITLVVDDVDSNNCFLYHNEKFEITESKGCSVKYFAIDDNIFDAKSHLPFGEIVA